MTKYYAGPWVWDDGSPSPHYRAPAGTVAVVDLRAIPTQSVGQHASGIGHGFFSGPDGLSLPSDYTLLGTGDLRDLQIGGAVRSAWQAIYGVTIPGDADHLIDCLSYTLTDGADPEGLSGPKPLVPGVGPPVGVAEINLAGHSVVYSSNVDVIRGQSRHARSLRHMMQRELENLADNDPDPELWRRVLGFQKRKYGQRWDDDSEDWFLTPKLRAKGKGRNGRTFANEPKTTATESWPTTGNITSGQDRSWSYIENNGYLEVSSGQLRSTVTLSGHSKARMGTAMSGSDTYAQEVFKSRTGTEAASYALNRKDATDSTWTFYWSSNYQTSLRLVKTVSASLTVLQETSHTAAADEVFKVEANGSAIKDYVSGVQKNSVTDTAISSGTYCGVGRYANSNHAYGDSWECGDIGGGGGATRPDLGLLLGVS